MDDGQRKADGGDPLGALKLLPKLIELLKQVQAADGADQTTGDDQEDDDDDESPVHEVFRSAPSIVAFQKSRLMWLDAKKKMKSELGTLRGEIVKQSSDDDDSDEILAVTDQMLGEFDLLDDRLEDILDDITSTAEGSARDAMRKRASAVISEYIGMLETPFFATVDDNPFKPVAVTSTAKESLGAIQRTLA